MGMGVLESAKSFLTTAAEETAGFTYNKDTKALEGWGKTWSGRGSTISRGVTMNDVGAFSPRNLGFAGSAFRTVMGTPLAAYQGYQENGLLGAASYVASDFLISGVVGTAAAVGVGGWGQLGIGVAGSVGMTVAGPPGAFAGAWMAKQVAVTGVRATVAAGLSSPVGWAVGLGTTAALAVAGGAYATIKGSYELLKAGYNHKQRMSHKIDSAGSTAAFMTKNAFTMRSRAVDAIRSSQSNMRSALGGEARPSSFSSYRKWSGGKVY